MFSWLQIEVVAIEGSWLSVIIIFTPHSKHGEQFCNFWTYPRSKAAFLPWANQDKRRDKPHEVWRIGGWHAIQCCVKKQFLFKTGKVQTYCCKQERGRHRTTKTNGRNQRTSNDIKRIKIFFHDLTCMFGYVWIYRCIWAYILICISIWPIVVWLNLFLQVLHLHRTFSWKRMWMHQKVRSVMDRLQKGVSSIVSHRKVQFFQWHHEDLTDGEKTVIVVGRLGIKFSSNNSFARFINLHFPRIRWSPGSSRDGSKTPRGDTTFSRRKCHRCNSMLWCSTRLTFPIARRSCQSTRSDSKMNHVPVHLELVADIGIFIEMPWRCHAIVWLSDFNASRARQKTYFKKVLTTSISLYSWQSLCINEAKNIFNH